MLDFEPTAADLADVDEVEVDEVDDVDAWINSMLAGIPANEIG